MDGTGRNTGTPGRIESPILIGAGLLHMLILHGVFYNTGILTAEWMDYFGTGGGVTSWVGTGVIGTALCFSPLASMLVRNFGLRKMAALTGLICGISIAASSFASNIFIVLVCWIIAGSCMAVHITPVLSYIVTRFGERRAIANGFVTAGSSIGTFVYPIFISPLLNNYGWRGCVLILGALTLNIIPVSMLYRSWGKKSLVKKDVLLKKAEDANDCDLKSSVISLDVQGLRQERQKSILETQPRHRKKLKDIIQLDMFKNRFFVLMLLHTAVFYMAVSVIYVHIVAGFRSLMDLTTEQARFTVTALGISNLIGRIFISCLVHHPSIDTFTIYLFAGMFAAIIGLVPFCKGFVAAMCMGAAIGFTLSGYGCLTQVVFVELLGEEFIQMAFSYSQLTGGVGYIIGAPIAGWLYDATGDYAVSFYFGASFALSGMAVLIPDWLIHIRNYLVGEHKERTLSRSALSNETKDWLASHLSLS